MKMIFKLLVTVALTLTLAGSILAQGPPPGRPGGPPGGPGGRFRMDPKRMTEMTKRRVQELKKALKLNSSQEKKVLAIMLGSNKKMGALFTNTKLKEDARRKQFEALRAKNDKAINAILTAKQRKLYAAWRAQHRRGRGGPGGPGGPGVRRGTQTAK